MSWNNVMPAWVVLGDEIIKDYHEGKYTYEEAKVKLVDLGCPSSMIMRLKEKRDEL